MSEVREVAGRKTAQVTIDGQTYTLASLMLDDTVEFEEQIGPMETHMQSMRGVRWLWVRCLMNGGTFTGTEAEAAALLTVDAIDDVTPVLMPLVSRSVERSYQRHMRLQALLDEVRETAEAAARDAGASELEVMQAGEAAVSAAMQPTRKGGDAVGEAVKRVTATRPAPSSASAGSTDGQLST